MRSSRFVIKLFAVSMVATMLLSSTVKAEHGFLNGASTATSARSNGISEPTGRIKRSNSRKKKNKDDNSGISRRERRLQRREQRKLNGKGDCGKCPTDTYYYYMELKKEEYFYEAFAKEQPTGCVLAAIRDEESRRAAQYAIPEGKIAITQGYFPIEDYIEECSFEDSKSDDGVVEYCEDDYDNYFENFEGTDVPDDSDCWVDDNLDKEDIPDGAIHVAVGSDGLLRAVQQWNKDTENSKFAYNGAVYECCPFVDEICEVPKT